MVDATGEPLFNLHTLRHFLASWAIERGFTSKRLQALLGHSSIQMNFDRYGNLPSRSSHGSGPSSAAPSRPGCRLNRRPLPRTRR